MIPKNIKKKHVLKTISEIDKNGIPPRRKSRKFYLEYNGNFYPPKYVISLANKYTNNEILDPSLFNGGNETNSFLRSLGFNIVGPSHKKKKPTEPVRGFKGAQTPKGRHDERCPKCKETFYKLLEKIYGSAVKGYKFNVGTKPIAFKDTSCYDNLNKIYKALQDHRGFQDFIRAKTLPNCDFFVPDLGIIVEFDESQHFTLPRKISLQHYPNKLRLGFDRKRWIELCERLHKVDNDPPYRDEQRAWYDTLRDFLPEILHMAPTTRLFSKDFELCTLDTGQSDSITKFKSLLSTGDKQVKWGITVESDSDPSLARILIAGNWQGEVDAARDLLHKVCEKWPRNKRVNCLVTCGAFIQFDWPEHLSRKEIGNNKRPNEHVVQELIDLAETKCKSLMDEHLRNKLVPFTEYITLGIDSYKAEISLANASIRNPHIELVGLLNLKTNEYQWIGKSYPTNGQENGLVRFVNLNGHFVDLNNIGRVMILGCHDLTIFNNRNLSNTGAWRIQIKEEFRDLAARNKPVCVLHHPHTTVKNTTWKTAFNSLLHMLPSVRQYISAGRYHESTRDKSKWDSLDMVRQATKLGNTIDFIAVPN